MSVAMLIYDGEGWDDEDLSPAKLAEMLRERSKMIPVATEDIFKRVWLVGAEALGLKWVPVCQSGLEIRDPGDRAELVAELERLGKWMEDRAADPIVRGSLDRLQRLVEALSAIEFPRQHAWIG